MTNQERAEEHWKKCKENPYSIGKVVAFTDTKQISLYFDYAWVGL